MSEENIYSFENPEYRKTYWHTCSHVLAQAVKRLYPEVKLAIGPAIDKCCFEVGKEVTEAVDKHLNSDASFFYDECENGKYMLDLRGVVRERFLQLGVLSENIEIVGDCTMCHPDKYFSHRYTKGERGSLACVIELS